MGFPHTPFSQARPVLDADASLGTPHLPRVQPHEMVAHDVHVRTARASARRGPTRVNLLHGNTLRLEPCWLQRIWPDRRAAVFACCETRRAVLLSGGSQISFAVETWSTLSCSMKQRIDSSHWTLRP